MATRIESLAGFRKWWSGGTTRRETPQAGTVYMHEAPGRSVELAEVLDTATDEFGIRHVRFRLWYRYQYKTMEAGERTLALDAFTGRFTRRADIAEGSSE